MGGDVILFGLRVIQLEDAFAGLPQAIDLLDLADQALEDHPVALQQPLLSLYHQVVYDRRLGLPQAIDAAVALDKGDDRPGQVIMNDVVTLVVQVDALGGDVSGQQQPDW